MGNSEKISIENPRDKTDKSLENERYKTDVVIVSKKKNIEKESDKEILLKRNAADMTLERRRSEVSLDKHGRPPESIEIGASVRAASDLGLERQRADKAQVLERQGEDRVRERERFQKRLVAEELLETERENTDTSLLDERHRSDVAAEKSESLLLDEKSSHDLTKEALITRDQFLAVVSHDLKNPLSAISMGASLLRIALSKGSTDVASLQKLLAIIERGAANMDRMITDLLDVERMAGGKLSLNMEMNDLAELLRESVQLFEPIAASKRMSLKITGNSDSICADFDHDKILQVVSNLVGNALKFSPKGSTITLSAERKKAEVEVRVTDDGPGIPNEKQTEIFERFSQLKVNDRRGLGLGLFISKWIVEAHKGRIWVCSEIGKGSTFTFSLPSPVSH